MVERYKKLVRDFIPDHIRANGETPKTKKLTQKEFKAELLRKLTEEVAEVALAKDRESLILELADVQEVLMALYEVNRIECAEVTKAGRLKRKQNGTFNKRLYLESVE